jgi:phosphinothricin acetyltransferase
MNIEFIDINKNDLEIVKDIYDYYILNSTATFHTEKISIRELGESMSIDHPKYNSFLIKYNGKTCGYCCISRYKKRQAYDRTAEITVYLMPEFTGKGIGKLAVEKLEKIARQKGISVLIGIIAGDNYQSINLFEKCGYEKCAHYKQIGEKFGKILDVVAYQKILE